MLIQLFFTKAYLARSLRRDLKENISDRKIIIQEYATIYYIAQYLIWFFLKFISITIFHAKELQRHKIKLLNRKFKSLINIFIITIKNHYIIKAYPTDDSDCEGFLQFLKIFHTFRNKKFLNEILR